MANGTKCKCIKISDWAKEILNEFKEVEGHTSFDGVIRSLIFRSLIPKALLEKKPTPSITQIKNVMESLPNASYKEILKKRIRDRGG